MSFLFGTALKLLLTTAAIVGVLLLVVGRGPARKLRVVLACVLLLAGGALLYRWPSGAMERPAEFALPPGPPGPPVAPIPPAWGEGGEEECAPSVAIDLGDLNLPELGDELRDTLEFGLRWEDGKVSLDGPGRLHVKAGSASQPADTPDLAGRAGESVRALVERALPVRLSRYFDRLIEEPPPSAEPLRDLRSQLQNLSETQRRRVAEEASRLRGLVERYRITALHDEHATSQGLRHYGVEAELLPEQIARLAAAERIVIRTDRARRASVGQVVLVTAGVIVAAAIVLKLATRRHFTR